MPAVSIIVPCYNEEKTIEFLLDAILAQDYPVEDIEIIIADGMSTDNTRLVIGCYQNAHPVMTVKLVDNPQKTIPSALNRAIDAAKGKYIIRFDAHSIPAPDYISRCMKLLEEGLAENVGGVWKIKSQTDHWISKSIAAAASHPIAAGDARYRYSNKPGYVDTVPFGSFRKEIFNSVGFFNEKLLTNEDYEFNVRICEKGGRIWFDPSIQSIYFARSDFVSLIKQYFRYGFWKYQMLLSYPKTLRWRQALPPLFVSLLVVLSLLSPWFWLARIFFGGVIALYIFILLLASIPFAYKNAALPMLVGIPISIAIMHMGWGTGFLWSMVKSLIRG